MDVAEQRLIDANALLDAMRDEEFQTFVPLDEIDSVIDKAPTIDAAPKVYGRWEFDAFTAKHGNPFRCSVCKEEYDNTHNFCPNCGARMDGGAANGNT